MMSQLEGEGSFGHCRLSRKGADGKDRRAHADRDLIVDERLPRIPAPPASARLTRTAFRPEASAPLVAVLQGLDGPTKLLDCLQLVC